jgi:formylglycine-generating enzyme required for sulfatase activity/energy-coupling factor transporter ATP-binding protein EcfA2
MHERLERLRQKLAVTDDPDLREALEDKIAALEKEAGVVPEPPAGDTITVGNLSQVAGVAVGTGARATVYIDGRQGKTNDELLAAYYQRLATRCRSMPLQGVYDQRSTADILAIDLEQVYTQLATTDTTPRERLTRTALAKFDVAHFLAAHTGDQLLPYDHRTMVEPRFPASFGAEQDSDAEERPSVVLVAAEGGGLRKAFIFVGGPQRLTDDANDRIERYAKVVDELTFLGPTMATEAMAANPHLVLLGEPGSGKSTALRYLAYILAGAGRDPQLDLAACLPGWTPGRLLPVFAPLLPLAQHFATHPARQGEAEDLWDYLVDHLQPRGANAGLAAAVHEEVEAGRVILLLDGLDEVAGAESRRKVVRAVQSFAERYPACRIVVACRVRAYEGERNAAWQLPGWPTATLADWTLGQMLAFVNAWYRTVATLRSRTDASRDERIAGLTRALLTREDLQRFGRQPLMITVMALVHLNDGRIPEERASLYGRCIDILLGQWEIAGKDASQYGTLMDYLDLPDADAQSLRPLLGRAAYEAHSAAAPGEVGQLSRAVLRTLVDDELKRRRHPNPSAGADRFLEYTDLRAGLIQANDAGDEYSFPHQTFQEYLAGIELFGGVDPLRRILDLRNDDRWRRPILLGVEQLALSSLDLPYRLLSQLVEEPGRDSSQRTFDLLLAQEIADDLGWGWLEQRDSLFTGLKRRLAQAMADTLREITVPARDLVRIGAILAELDDPRPGVCDLPPAMVELANGNFVIGKQWGEDGFREEYNRKAIAITAFDLARYPVTNAQYGLFIRAGGYDPEAPWWQAEPDGQQWLRQLRRRTPSLWDDESFVIARPNYPIVGVTCYEAMAFCRWLTQYLEDQYEYRLPSEAEWEYAARGIERRIYPWGSQEPDCERLNGLECYGAIAAVGCFPRGATPEGVLDMAGNIWEWMRSEFRPYPYDPDDGREDDRNPGEKRFARRGGSWHSHPTTLRAAYRTAIEPGYSSHDQGFRLARHPRPRNH